jgi:hypothetical protein
MNDFDGRDYMFSSFSFVGQKTPRLFMLAITGKDMDGLRHPVEKRDLSWEEVRGPRMEILLSILQHSPHPPTIIVTKKETRS